MTDMTRGGFGKCDYVKKVPSRGVTCIIIELPIEYHVAAVNMFDGKNVLVVEAPPTLVGPYGILGATSGEKTMNQKVEKPYGKLASELYASGFFLQPNVLAAIGSDDDFLRWIRKQPCAMTGQFDYNKDEETGEVREACEAAHVRRITDGAGVAEKPPYSAIPLIHLWHAAQTQYGERVFDVDPALRKTVKPNTAGDPAKGRAWMDKQRVRYVTMWGAAALSSKLQYQSTGFIPPNVLHTWAIEAGVAEWLPNVYRSD